MNKKIYLKIIIILFYITTFFSIWNTFWNDVCNKIFDKLKTWDNGSSKAPICTSSPDFIDKYFSNNINILNKISWESNSSSNAYFALWSKTLQTTLWSVWISAMFWVSWMWDFFQNFYILKEDPNVVRDWTKIINFKQYITKKALLGSRKWILLNNVPQNIKDQINSSNSFIFGTYNIHTYTDLFSYLWNNQMAFEKIYYDKIVLLNNREEIINSIISTYTWEEQNIEHINNIISEIESNYFKWDEKIKCNHSWNEFVDAMKNITCNLWWDKLSKASKRFSCNYNRLLYALNLWWSEWNCWSVKLKKEFISLTGRLEANVSIEWFWKIISNNIWWWIKHWISSTWNWMKKIWNIILHPVDNLTKNNTTKYNIINWWNSTIINNSYFDDQIKNIQKQIKIDYDNTIKLTKIEPSKVTNGITPLFPEISYNIYKIIKKIDDESNWIYELTAKACENQSPFVWDCRY